MSTARCFGGRCWSAATNARRIVSRATATSAGSPSGATRSSGIGSTQVDSGQQVEVAGDGLLRRPEVHRQGAALASFDHVEADVRRDPVEPRAQRGPALEAVEATPRAHERLLDGVLGVERRAEHPVAVAGELSAVLLEALGDGRSRTAAPGPYYGPCGCWRRDAPRRSSSSATTACSGASRRAGARPRGGGDGARPRARLPGAGRARGARRLARARARRRADDAGRAPAAAVADGRPCAGARRAAPPSARDPVRGRAAAPSRLPPGQRPALGARARRHRLGERARRRIRRSTWR